MIYAEPEQDSKQEEKIHVTMDGIHFGRDFVFLLFRSGGKNIYWNYYDSEKAEHYESALKELIRKYIPSSFTIDGKRGVRQLLNHLFPGLPVQYCQFHLMQTVLRYITKRPKTNCGIELIELCSTLKYSSRAEFTERFKQLQNDYKDFLAEKNESGKFAHSRLRSAFRVIKNNLPYLFTFEKFPELKIEKTTNSCEGYFSHLKNKVRVHPGISIPRKIQMISKLPSC